MTAMMAFFLVLWIINATDKDTKTIIARYFNPVKLENPARAQKGVHGVDSNTDRQREDYRRTAKPRTAPPNNQGGRQKAPPPLAPPGGAPAKKEENPKPAAARPAAEQAVDVKPTMSEAAMFSDPYRSWTRSPAVAPRVPPPRPTPAPAIRPAKRARPAPKRSAIRSSPWGRARSTIRPLGRGRAAAARRERGRTWNRKKAAKRSNGRAGLSGGRADGHAE